MSIVGVLNELELAALRADPWFVTLTGAQQQQLLSLGRKRQLSAGQPLFSRGDAFCGIYVLLDGQLLISGLHQSGQQALLTLLTPGQWLGEIALFDQKPRTHDAAALQETVLWHLPKAALQQLVHADPLWWQAFGQLLTSKLRQVFIELEDRAVLSAAQRLARRLVQLSQQQADIPLQQEQLGQLLSLSRQTTNQLLRQLVAQGLIQTQYGGITVLNRPALLQLAQA
jgi:CRP-like cAMP-binding protein